MKTLKHFTVYQFFVDPQYRERNLLVGVVQASTETEAKGIYLLQSFPDDPDKREFTLGFLSAFECTEAIASKCDSVIEESKKLLGIWGTGKSLNN